MASKLVSFRDTEDLVQDEDSKAVRISQGTGRIRMAIAHCVGGPNGVRSCARPSILIAQLHAAS
jgi:hypothetical protein